MLPLELDRAAAAAVGYLAFVWLNNVAYIFKEETTYVGYRVKQEGLVGYRKRKRRLPRKVA